MTPSNSAYLESFLCNDSVWRISTLSYIPEQDTHDLGDKSLLIIEMVSGFLFWFIIIVLVLATERFGYDIFSDLDAEAKLHTINADPSRFRISTMLVLIEHTSIILLAAFLFIAFSPYNLILAIIWTTSRIGEGLIQIYNKRRYWGLLDVARQYSITDGAEKNALIGLGESILRRKNTSFACAQVLFSIGTLAYSIVFAVYEPIPAIIGWFGIVASILYGLGSGITLAKQNFKALWNLGGLLIWIFEIVLGGWLLFHPLI